MKIETQVNINDCGLVVAQAIHNHFYEKKIHISVLREMVPLREDGLSITNLKELLKKININSNAFKANFSSIKDSKINDFFITIIQHQLSLHYVIILKITKTSIIYLDPIFGKVKKTHNEFDNIWSKIVITAERAKKYNDFISVSKSDIIFVQSNWKNTIIFSLSSLFVLIISFISLFYIKTIVDTLLPLHNFNKILLFSISFIFLALLKLLFMHIKNYWMRKIVLKNKKRIMDLYFESLSRNDRLKNEKISISDHLKQISYIEQIITFKLMIKFTLFSEVISVIFSTIILFAISKLIFLILLIISLSIIGISILYKKKYESIFMKNIECNAQLTQTIIHHIDAFDKLKSGYFRDYYQNKFDNNFYKNIDEIGKGNNVQICFDYLNKFAKLLVPFVVTIVTTSFIFKDEMSVGDLLIFLVIFQFFNAPIETISNLILEYPTIKNKILELESFMNVKNDFREAFSEKIKTIDLENIIFSYNQRPLLNINKLNIKNKLRLSGNNGAGKSTLLKIISHQIRANGNILLNNKDSKQYSEESIANKIFYLDSKHEFGFESIFEYLTMKNQRMIQNFNKFFKNEDIQQLLTNADIDLGDNVYSNTTNLSTGQRSIIALLRIITIDPDVVLLDEVFENIDDKNIFLLQKILRKFLDEKIVIEISHSNNFLFREGVININEK